MTVRIQFDLKKDSCILDLKKIHIAPKNDLKLWNKHLKEKQSTVVILLAPSVFHFFIYCLLIVFDQQWCGWFFRSWSLGSWCTRWSSASPSAHRRNRAPSSPWWSPWASTKCSREWASVAASFRYFISYKKKKGLKTYTKWRMHERKKNITPRYNFPY